MAALLAAVLPPVLALGSLGFGAPAIGFNTCNVNCGNATFPNAAFVLATARALRARGFAAAGYSYVNMDGGWMEQSNAQGTQVPVPSKFPRGLRALVDELHGL